MQFIPVMAKLSFQHHYSCLQCHMTHHVDLLLNKHFLLLSMLKTVVLLNIFVETILLLYQYYLMNSSKKQHFLECNIK